MTAPLKRRSREVGSIGWLISDHSVDRYIERVRPGLTQERARCELLTHCTRAHFVKELPAGLEQWRGPSPWRLRLRVQRDGERLVLATVLPAFDGLGPPCR